MFPALDNCCCSRWPLAGRSRLALFGRICCGIAYLINSSSASAFQGDSDRTRIRLKNCTRICSANSRTHSGGAILQRFSLNPLSFQTENQLDSPVHAHCRSTCVPAKNTKKRVHESTVIHSIQCANPQFALPVYVSATRRALCVSRCALTESVRNPESEKSLSTQCVWLRGRTRINAVSARYGEELLPEISSD